MANNYTISSVVTVETPSDSVASGTISSTAELYVTPDSGYVIQASDFSITNSLPAQVVSVVFTDTVAALNLTNKVKATVTLASWYVMPASNATIEIDIDGSTHLHRPRLKYRFVSTSDSLATIGFDAEDETGAATSTSGSIVTLTRQQDIIENTTALVAQCTVQTDSGYHFTETPTITVISENASSWRIELAENKTNNPNARLYLSLIHI